MKNTFDPVSYFRPFLCGTRRVTYEVGRYVVRGATDDRLIATYLDKQSAINHAVNSSNRK